MTRILAVVGMLVLGFVGLPARAQEMAWEPDNTLVFVVGLLKWQNSEAFVSFPAKNRRDAYLANFFEKAGVPKDRLIYLQDKAATLASIRRNLNKLLKDSQPGQTLIVYYEGHGYSDEEENSPVYFANYDAETDDVGGWPTAELVSTIDKNFKGDRVILMADCCQSGELAALVKNQQRRLSYACFGSSQRDKSSTENWTFTEGILAALRGEGPVDADHDGAVTMKEMRHYLRSEMIFAEDQKSTSALTGEWKPTDVIAKSRPMTCPREGEHVEVYSEDDWWLARILDEKDGKYKIFYYGYENEDIEWVGPKQIRGAKDSPELKQITNKISSQLGLGL